MSDTRSDTVKHMELLLGKPLLPAQKEMLRLFHDGYKIKYDRVRGLQMVKEELDDELAGAENLGVARANLKEALDALEAIVESAAKAYINDWVPQELEHAEAILRKHGRVI